MNKNPDKIKGNPSYSTMDSVHQGPHYIPDLTREGRVHSDKILAKLNQHPKAAEFQQLCLYNPAKEGHVATGVKRADLGLLQKISDALYEDTSTTIKLGVPAYNAVKILRTSGIDPQRFTPHQRIHLARLLGEGVVSAEWALVIQDALENGNLTSDLVNDMIGDKIEGQKRMMEVVQGTAGKGVDLSPFNAGELHQIASLLLSKGSSIDGTWIEQHATALAQGGITHGAFQDILIKAKDIAEESARTESSAKVEEQEKAKQIEEYPLTHAAGIHGFKQHAAGFHSSTQSWHAMVAREIAQRVIGKDGKIDNKAIARIREEMGSEVYLQSAPKDPHTAHVLAMLDALENNEGGMRDLVESIGAPKQPLTSKAAHKIRSTLGLAPDTPITQVHARQAALSALLANMRQHAYVGSCFATAVAIRVHDNDPIRFLREIKSLIENDYLEAKGVFAEIQLPIATSVNLETVRKEININVINDGEEPPYAIICDLGGIPMEETLPLHEVPAMKAALNALKIPEGEHRNAILDAVKEIGTEKISIEAILEQVITSQKMEGKAAKQQLAFAIDAFEAQESNPLIRSWEYTLACLAGSSSVGSVVVKLKDAIVHTRDSNTQKSLMDAIGETLEIQLSGIGIGKSTQKIYLKKIEEMFQLKLESMLHARFQASLTQQINTNASGWEIYYRGEDGTEIPIHSDEDFKNFLLSAFDATCKELKEEFSSESSSQDIRLIGEAFSPKELIEALEKTLSGETTVSGIVEDFNESFEIQNTRIHRTPTWFLESGGFPKAVLRGLYNVATVSPGHLAATDSLEAKGNNFLLHLVLELKRTLKRNNIATLPENITTEIEGHMLNIVPNTDPRMRAIMESSDSEQKLNELFLDPGKALAQKNFSEVEIQHLVTTVFAAMGDESLAESLLPEIVSKLDATSRPVDIYNACIEQFDLNTELGQTAAQFIEHFLILALNPPTIAFADTNYYNSLENGNTYISCVFNPITEKVELWNSTYDGTDFNLSNRSSDNYQTTVWISYLHPSFYPELQETQEMEVA